MSYPEKIFAYYILQTNSVGGIINSLHVAHRIVTNDEILRPWLTSCCTKGRIWAGKYNDPITLQFAFPAISKVWVMHRDISEHYHSTQPCRSLGLVYTSKKSNFLLSYSPSIHNLTFYCFSLILYLFLI